MGTPVKVAEPVSIVKVAEPVSIVREVRLTLNRKGKRSIQEQ